MIVNLTGGLGNQLFMYAFGRGVAETTGRPLGFCWKRSVWDYVLDRYVDVLLVTDPCGPIYRERSMLFDKEVYHPAASEHYFCGYWQTEKYFRHIAGRLRDEIQPRFNIDREWLIQGERLAAENSVLIHVRRGDYTLQANVEAHGIVPVEYYTKAMATFPMDAKFYAFSDDKEWCRNNLPGVVVLPTPSADVDFYLMRHCHHAIIANSSFGWWAAFLGPDCDGGTVIAPKKWFGPTNQHIDTSDLIPARWLTV
jgi:hypothetical protein